jgi:hypothetical protein
MEICTSGSIFSERIPYDFAYVIGFAAYLPQTQTWRYKFVFCCLAYGTK